MADRFDALKTLLTRLIDSREGYRKAVDGTESAHVKDIFTEFMARRDRSASEIRGYLRQEGHSADDDGSILASAHRNFMALRDLASSADEAAILLEVVRGEKTLLDAYDVAISAVNDGAPEYEFLVAQHSSLASAIRHLEGRQRLAA
ncbi:MAG: PA2169 family four-helix-bundle protein [Pseudomonadota bacterium]